MVVNLINFKYFLQRNIFLVWIPRLMFIEDAGIMVQLMRPILQIIHSWKNGVFMKWANNSLIFFFDDHKWPPYIIFCASSLLNWLSCKTKNVDISLDRFLSPCCHITRYLCLQNGNVVIFLMASCIPYWVWRGCYSSGEISTWILFDMWARSDKLAV